MTNQLNPTDDELAGKATLVRFLSLLLLAVMLVVEIAIIIIWLFNPEYPVIWDTATLMSTALLSLASYRLAKASRTRAASYLFVATLTLFAFAASYFFGGAAGPLAVIYLFPIFIATLLLERRATFLVATAASALLLASLGMEITGLVPQALPGQWSEIAAGSQRELILMYMALVTYIASFYAAAFLGWYYTSQLRRAFQRLHRYTDELKTANASLTTSEQFFRLLADNANDVIYSIQLSPQVKFNYISPSVERIMGYTPEDFYADPYLALKSIHPEDVHLFQELQDANRPSDARLVLRWIRKDGSIVYTEIYEKVFFDDAGNPIAVHSVGRDITERMRADQELRQSEGRYKALVENIPQKIFHKDRNSVYISCNANYAQDLGITPAEIMGKTDYDFFPKELAEKYIADDKRIVQSGEMESFEETYIQNGQERTVQTYKAPVKDAEGNVTGVLGIFYDITERKRAEQELKQKNELLDVQNKELRATHQELHTINKKLEATNRELEAAQEHLVRSERLAAIGELAGGVGHELRNPLGAIKNAVYYVKGKVASSELADREPRVTEFLNVIDNEIGASSKIIEDLLGFSRVGKPQVSPVSLKQVVEEVLSRLSIPRNIVVANRLEDGLPDVELDADQFRQVFFNLFDNAVQAMPEGGQLTISASKKDRFLKVEIADTGCGMAEEARIKIFEPLFTTRAKGIGLGLSVCRSIIERHGGSIGVESEPGRGTAFTIRLPLGQQQWSD